MLRLIFNGSLIFITPTYILENHDIILDLWLKVEMNPLHDAWTAGSQEDTNNNE